MLICSKRWSDVNYCKFNTYSSGEIKKFYRSPPQNFVRNLRWKTTNNCSTMVFHIFPVVPWPGYFINLPHRSLNLTLFYTIWIIYSDPPTHTHSRAQIFTHKHTHPHTQEYKHTYTDTHTHTHTFTSWKRKPLLLHHCTPTKQITPSKVFQYFAQ